jgi:hypothetical protein
MTEAQADQIIDFLYGMLRPPDAVETRKAWRLSLAPLDADLASQAAINGKQVWEFFPSWPLFYGEYRAVLRKSKTPEPTFVCPTCEGDKFVVVALRKPEASQWLTRHGIEVPTDRMIEELAPCPDCNSTANTYFRRYDGSEAKALDPARVREMMSG